MDSYEPQLGIAYRNIFSSNILMYFARIFKYQKYGMQICNLVTDVCFNL